MANEILKDEFQKLYDRRELATWNCVNAVQFVLWAFEAQDFEQTREMLQRAFDGYKQADDAITEFHSQLKKENSTDGNRTDSASDAA